MKPVFLRTSGFLALFLFSASLLRAGETAEQHDARMQWWRDARFGMFIHWGVSAVPASGEWIMSNSRIPVAEYKKYAAEFNPVKFDADAWVKLAKEAGAKYIVITAKHHDGFALFRSAASPWNIYDATPFKRDPLKEIAAACRKYGIKLGFYYSQSQDWTHPGGNANSGHWDKAQEGDFMTYIKAVAVPQVRELLTNYGDVAILWWDTPGQGMSREAAELLKKEIARQPQLIMNNRLVRGDAGDFTTPENSIPATGLDADWETCMTMNNSWGYSSADHGWKSSRELLQHLIDTASKGGNYLLNIGPTAEGVIPPPSVERLKEIGAWMKVNFESIYGTTASPFRILPWGRCTKKVHGDTTTLYAQVFDWPADGKLVLPGLKNKILEARLLADGSSLRVNANPGGFPFLDIPAKAPDPIASVVVVEIAGTPDVDPLWAHAGSDGVIPLALSDIRLLPKVYRADKKVRIDGKGTDATLANWGSSHDAIEWPFRVDQKGKYTLAATLAAGKDAGRITVSVQGKKAFTFEIPDTGGEASFKDVEIGIVDLPAGIVSLRWTPVRTGTAPPWGKDDETHWKGLALKEARLVPISETPKRTAAAK